MTPVDGFRRQLVAVGDSDAPRVTAALDLRPGPLGSRPPAVQLFQQKLQGGDTKAVTGNADDARTLATARQRGEALLLDAIARGSKGLFYLGGETELSFETQVPFRNSIAVGRRPRLFEFERFAYLYSRPVVIAIADRHTVELARVQFGETVGESGVDYGEHPLTRTAGRTAVEGRSGASVSSGGETKGYSGGHSWNRVEQIVEEHRAMFAREAADEMERFLGGDEFLLVGPEEARSQLLSELSPGTAERAVLVGASVNGVADQSSLADVALELAAERQVARANELSEAKDLAPDLLVRGREDVRRYLAGGQLSHVVFHEDAVGHLGTAEDAREHAGLGHDDEFEELVAMSLATSAEVLFGTAEPLIDEMDGVVGLRRW